MGPKKVVAKVNISPNSAAEKEHEGSDVPDEVKAVRKVSPHPSTMEMVKEALSELDQRKGVSAQAIRAFIKEKHSTVDETRIKTMVRKALVKGIESGTLVRPANSSTTTGAQGRFRLAVRKPKAATSKENSNPNVAKTKDQKAKAGNVKTKKVKAAEGDKPAKKPKNDASASKVAPAKKPKAKQAAGGTAREPESETQNASTKSQKSGEKPAAKKRGKKAEGDGGGENLAHNAATEDHKSADGGNEVTVQKKGGRKAAPKADDGENKARPSGKKGKRAAEK